MATISACLIVKNESSCIKNCLNSIYPLCDEIIIYDTGSNDGTQDICNSYSKVTLIQGIWENDFAKARNESFKYATKDYIIWVDADDLIDEKSLDYLIKLKESNLSEYDIIVMPYRYHFDGKKDLYTLDRERIIKRSLQPKWVGRIHEYIKISGKSLYLTNNEAYVIHNHQKPYGNRNLLIFREMEKNNEITSARDKFYFANELYDNKFYEEAIKWYKDSISEKEIWIIDKLNACMRLYYIYRYIYNDIDNAFIYASLAMTCTDTPRSDVCCALGDIYMAKNNLDWAIKWYSNAYNNIAVGFNSVFLQTHTYTTTPLLQLCVLYYGKGDLEKSYEMNKLAESYDPNNEIIKHNNEFFENILNKKAH